MLNIADPVDDRLAAAERAYRALRTQILSGAVLGGTRLSEAQVADSLGVSRTPVREALLRLQSEGLVWFERYRGARVASFTAEDLLEIYELRVLLEGMAAARAATRMTAKDMDALDANLVKTEQLLANWNDGSVEAFVDVNRVFHSIIVDAANSKRLKATIVPLIDMPTHGQPAQVREPSFIADALNHHRLVTEALRSKDPEWSRTQMQAHLAQARTRGAMPPRLVDKEAI